MSELPTVALSIKQPWADLICYGLKDIENRDWTTRFRGPVLIHAGKQVDQDALDNLYAGLCPADGVPMPPTLGIKAPLHRGGIVGVAEIVDCVSESASRWFMGRYGFVIHNARPINFIPCRDQLSFFRPDLSALNPKGDAP